MIERPAPQLALFALSLFALSQGTAHAAVPFHQGFPETSPDRIYRLSEVKRGQKGIGYTVFQADKIEPFEFEVLGLMKGMLGPGRDIILVKLSGKKIEFTGVIAGMSGSPAYIDDRLVGAVGFRFGAFSKEPIAGITPIQDMIDTFGTEVEARPKRATSGFSGYEGPLGVDVYRARTLLPDIPVPASPFEGAALKPIATPITMSGLHPNASAALSKIFEAQGFHTVVGGGAMAAGNIAWTPRKEGPRPVDKNQADSAGTVPAAPIAPGSPIAGLLVRGAINIASIGTVTMVNKGRVLAFGHPFFGSGHASIPMATAAIVNTLASDAGSYKQGVPAREVGAILQDRLSAIGGYLGQSVSMVPVRVLVQKYHDAKAHPGIETTYEIIDDPVWLPIMLDNVLASAAIRRLGHEVGGTVAYEARIHVGDHTVSFTDALSGPAPRRLSATASRDVSTTVALIARNEFEPASIRGIEVIYRTTSEVIQADLLRVLPAHPRARAGETIELTAVLQRHQGEEYTVPVKVPIPSDAEGQIEVYVGGGLELDRRDARVYGGRRPQKLEDLLAILTERRPSQAVFARVYLKRPGVNRRVDLYASLPPSQRATLLAHRVVGQKAIKEAPGPEVRIPTKDVVTGGIAVSIDIEP